MLLKGLLVLVILTAVRGNLFNYTVLPDQMRWKDALAACQSLGPSYSLPSFLGQEEIAYISDKLEQERVTEAWLPLNKTRFPTWVWLDGQPVSTDFSNQNWRDFMVCGVLHVRDHAIEVDRCATSTYGYVCELNEGQTCVNAEEYSTDCHMVKGRAFVHGCTAANWYDAKYRCSKRGWKLALTKTEDVWLALYNEWYVNNRKNCEQLWMGLRREEWYYRGINHSEEAIKMDWDSNEPSANGFCAGATRIGPGKYAWRSNSCNVNKTVACFSFPKPTPSPTTTPVPTTNIPTRNGPNPQQADPTPGSGGGSIVGPVVGAICGVGALIAIVIIGICIYMRKKRATHKEYISVKMIREEEKDPNPNRIPPEQFLPILHNAGFKDDDIRTFDFKGGKFETPKSQIVLDIPQHSIPGTARYPIGCKIHTDLEHGHYKIPKAERIICPVPEFRAPDVFLNPVTVQIPHNITEQGIKDQIKVYHWDRLTDKHVQLASKEQDTRPWFEVKDNMVFIHTTNIGTFICTCTKKGLKGLGYCGLLIAKYTEPEVDRQELAVEVHVLDRIYAMDDFLKPLDDAWVSEFSEISLAEGFSEEKDLLLMKFSSTEMDDWEYVNLVKTDDPSVKEVRLSKLASGDEDSAMNLLGRFVVSRLDENNKRDSMLINLKVLVKKTSSDEEPEEILSFTERVEFKTCKSGGKIPVEHEGKTVP